MKVKSESEVAHLCPTFHDPMDHSLPGSSIHGILQGRVLEWVAIAFSSMEHYSAIKKDEIMPFAATWTDLEIIILSEVSQTKTNSISPICGV